MLSSLIRPIEGHRQEDTGRNRPGHSLSLSTQFSSARMMLFEHFKIYMHKQQRRSLCLPRYPAAPLFSHHRHVRPRSCVCPSPYPSTHLPSLPTLLAGSAWAPSFSRSRPSFSSHPLCVRITSCRRRSTASSSSRRFRCRSSRPANHSSRARSSSSRVACDIMHEFIARRCLRHAKESVKVRFKAQDAKSVAGGGMLVG